MAGIYELLVEHGLEKVKDGKKVKVKAVRHAGKSRDFGMLERQRWIEVYQAYQNGYIFECPYVVSFVGTEGCLARLHGVYLVTLPALVGKDLPPVPAKFPIPNYVKPSDVYYKLLADGRFEELVGTVIDWGKATKAWHQWLDRKHDKRVVTLPRGPYS
jgi:hypothetical protein